MGVLRSPAPETYRRGSWPRTRLTEFAVRQRLPIVEAVKEVGSGLNGHRKGMMRLLRDPKVGAILVEHRDRLVRFGFE